MQRIFFLIFGTLLFFSCENVEKEQVQALNPNGDSELALLMRKMETDLQEMKVQLRNGKSLGNIQDYSALLTAQPTQESLKKPNFESFAKSFIGAAKALKAAEKDQQKAAYERLVETCYACHDDGCRGPLPRIEKLYLPDNSQ